MRRLIFFVGKIKGIVQFDRQYGIDPWMLDIDRLKQLLLAAVGNNAGRL